MVIREGWESNNYYHQWWEGTRMNKYGLLSLLMVTINLIVFFILRGPEANAYAGIIIFSILSITGIVLAILSKKWYLTTAGVILNGGVLIFAFFLLLSMGISES